MKGIAGFIDYDGNGKPFMGIIIEDDITRVQVFLARKAEAQQRVDVICASLQKLAAELRKSQDKVVPVKGDVNAIVRQRKSEK